jgi:hypothetical protein
MAHGRKQLEYTASIRDDLIKKMNKAIDILIEVIDVLHDYGQSDLEYSLGDMEFELEDFVKKMKGPKRSKH